MSNLTQTLLACQSPDQAVRSQAEQTLASAEKSNFPEFAFALATELSTETTDLSSRQLAGLHFKNLLVAKDDTLQQSKHDAWKAMDATQRASIKSLLLTALRSEQTIARHTAAQACAEVAAIELPFNEWPEFVQVLMENVQSTATTDVVKISSLECLGYTCERIANLEDVDIDSKITDALLNTIVAGIHKDRPDEIRLSAAIALRNSLLFSRKNMENKEERDMILQTICEATQCSNEDVRAAAYECIVQIAFQYYDKLQEYMQAIFGLTFKSIQEDVEKVALQAIEFWSTLCEEEMELLEEAQECAASGIPASRTCVGYVAAALDHLIPLLTSTMTKQDEDADVDDEIWNLSMAASTCLGLVSATVENAIVPAVMPFVQENIKSENWRLREAATMAFSCTLEGPSQESMTDYVNQAIPVLLEALSDPHDMVKDTTAWTIGRICELHVQAIPHDKFPPLVEGLTGKLLSERPSVAAQACFALHNLAAAFDGDEAAMASGTNALSVYMQSLIEVLLQVADREDANENNLRVAAFEAISVLIQNSAPDCKNLLVQLLPVMVQRLQASFAVSVLTNEDKEQKEGVQGLLAGLIQVLVFKLEKAEVMPHADLIMQNLLMMLQVKNATCHEEAYSAISAMCSLCEEDFDKYMESLAPFLIAGLENFQSYHVCTIAVGLVGDIARGIEIKIQPHCHGIMTALVKALQDQSMHRSVKPPVLSCFGDIALALGAQYEPYMQVSLMMLMQASQTTVSNDDEELIEFMNQLREGVLEAYTGIIQGLKDGNRVDLIAPYVTHMINFLEMCMMDDNKDEQVLQKAAGLLGDIANSLGPTVKDQLGKPFVQSLLATAFQNGDETARATCNWAREEVQRALQS